MKHRLIPAVLLIAVLGSAGCGKSSHKDALAGARASDTSTTATTVPGKGGSTTTTTARSRGATTTSTTAKPGTATTATTIGPNPYATTPVVPLTARMDQQCVHPGETQGITINGVPEADVGYDTVYSDRSNSNSHPYRAGFGKGKTDRAGVFHETWLVPLDAPAGPATVLVAGATHRGKVDRTSTAFLIKPLGQAC